MSKKMKKFIKILIVVGLVTWGLAGFPGGSLDHWDNVVQRAHR